MYEHLENKYMLVPHPFDPVEGKTCIKIIEGPFSDIIYKYGRFKIDNVENEVDVTATYEYDIILVPDELKDKQFTDEEGEQLEFLIGEILMKLLAENYEEISANLNDNSDGVSINENRTTDYFTVNT